ncbi:acyltransferase family protein [Aliikangiella maris]|uniref:Acyltransferase family protein n=2 Tax=Aliikangiella maris TaxID=3162458 RepID=A0ABV2BQG6_9GAMM
MQFRKDINALRAVAVIAVVLFHFNPAWMPGGFAGVDVFFVISGFLMTGIVFRGLATGHLSVLQFYRARANRIIPALAILCITVLIVGWFFISPLDYKKLGLHIVSSLTFWSNFTYWYESGYFADAAQNKWLLHSWSLSVEWQFYLLYPLVLAAFSRIFSIEQLKKLVVYTLIIGFVINLVMTFLWPDAAYYLLPARAWEMLFGALAYLYPLKLSNKQKVLCQRSGLILILVACFLVSENSFWPGYWALLPVLGTWMVIQSDRPNSRVMGHVVLQKLGNWSYSIYLWHWPLVVAGFYYSLDKSFIISGILLSVLLGFISYHLIEQNQLFHQRANKKIFMERTSPDCNHSPTLNKFNFVKWNPFYNTVLLLSVTLLISGAVIINNGFINLAPIEYQRLIDNAKPSPYREKCHLTHYQEPAKSCEYFGRNIQWAVLGDSHSTEIAYALAEKLKTDNIGIKHLTFTQCKPSYGVSYDFDKCARWYNEAIEYIIQQKDIQHVVLNHRFTRALFGGSAYRYPVVGELTQNAQTQFMLAQLTELIQTIAAVKQNVYVYYPIPELPRSIQNLIGHKLLQGAPLNNVTGTSLDWYHKRNHFMIDYFKNADFPTNVHLINTQDTFCDKATCYAVKNGEALYFDDDHPSVIGARKLVALIE